MTGRPARHSSGRIGVAAASLVLAAVFASPTFAAALLAVTNNDSYTTLYETRINVPAPGVLANDLNIGVGRPEVVIDVKHGNLTLRNDGSFHYKPDDGYTGTDTFTYRIDDLLSTTALVQIKVVQPDATSTPTPTPTAAPTSTPTPTPTAAPTPTRMPTPRPTPTVVLPSLPNQFPTPRPTAMPRPTPTPTAAGSTAPTDSPVPTPTPDGSSAPTSSPSGVGLGGGTTGGATGAKGDPTFNFGTGTGNGSGDQAGVGHVDVQLGLSLELVVPSVALVVPGLLLILAVLAQSLGALAWLPFVKRTLGEERSPGRRRRRSFA